MEKLGEESAAKFINALIKSVQTLCHGYLDFQNGVEIIGHINLNVDKGSSLDYILKEKVCKNAENSTLFISNSFHAEPKPDQDVSGKTSQSGNQVAQNNESSDAAETGRVSSAISSISTALTESRERLRRNSGARDSNSFHSLPNTAKRKASEEENSECHPAKISYHDRLSHVTSESSYPAETSSPIDSKEALLALRTAESDLSETVLPQTASVRSDGSDIGVNLAGSVLEPVEGQLNADLPEREEDSDGDLEVTFIKEEYVEGEGSACDFDGQQFASGQHQRGSDGMPDPSLFSMGPQSSSAPATYVPSAAGQQFPVSGSSSSASQPQPGPSGMRGLTATKTSTPTPKRKLKILSLKTKIEIINEVENNPGKQKSAIANQFSIPRSTLSTILRDSQKYKKLYLSGHVAVEKQKNRKCKHEDIDIALLEWVKVAQAANIPISRTILMEKATEIAKKLEKTDWQCSDGWLHRFKKRHDIVCNTTERCGRKPAWMEEVLKPKIAAYSPKDVFKANNSG